VEQRPCLNGLLETDKLEMDHVQFKNPAKLTRRNCNLGISGRKWPCRSYTDINLTRRENASSSGICNSQLITGVGFQTTTPTFNRRIATIKGNPWQ
jgi:hypothetical protein